jgi:DNA polymerase gamma 1
MNDLKRWRRLFGTAKRLNAVAKASNKLAINKNPCGIQHLSDGLHKQLFPKLSLPKPTAALTKASLKYLQDNELLGKPCSVNPEINFRLPKLQGDNINQHFYNIGLKSNQKYSNQIQKLLNIGLKPLPKPDKWIFQSGWTRYSPGEEPKPVPYPLEDELVYDCEVLYKMSPYPVLATCMSPKAWYSWCSPYLTQESDENTHLIPFGVDKRECIIVGHNVSFDRARVLEEYSLNASKAFYIDTMSLHVAVSGMCSRQRGTWMKYKKNIKEKIKSQEKTLEEFREMIENEELRYTMSNLVLDEESADDDSDLNNALHHDPWMKSSSLNKLNDVAELHCGIKMEKQLRDHFASTDPQEIRDLFQELMTYCADDVLATYRVYQKVYPMFKSLVPHPVSFSALRHINTSFLPTSTDWKDYIQRCEKMYQESKGQVEEKVHKICQEVVDLRVHEHDEVPPWETDPWLCQFDWKITPVKLTKSGKPYKNQKLPGYPEWYKKLVVKNELNLTIKSRCTLLLLKLLWENKPIFWTESKGWCFIVDEADAPAFTEKKYIQFDPMEILMDEALSDDKSKSRKSSSKQLKAKSKEKTKTRTKSTKLKTKSGLEKEMEEFTAEANGLDAENDHEDVAEEEKIKFTERDPIVRKNLEKLAKERKVLFKIPHENGADARVTSLISKPFLRYYEDGILSSTHKLAKEAFETNVTNSYWVSSRERIMNQFVVFESNLNSNGTLDKLDQKHGIKELGFIIPQIIPMGTITRRAVEKTWLTASNAKKTRLGSELKSLVQAPPGYCFVGADVDSEELWIASLVGDSVFRLHGGNALSWMTLEGTKNAGTDLHSKTAKILGISRNEAKVFNYGRIYGAGVKFATSLLKKFNPTITDEMADKVAKQLYAETKGKTSIVKMPLSDAKVKLWYGGSESVVFNRLECIAEQDYPKTPVLGAGITAALNRTNLNSKSFLPSRINWAIQSSGVDYLHLLLVSMEYLCMIYGIDARLAITVHDEVRYMVKKEDRYKCAMLLQIANLWTRTMFCFQLGIENVPQSCAFFSCVDIDFVLRKEVDFDCITPSNPNPIPPGESLDIYQLLDLKEVKEMLNGLNDDSSFIDGDEYMKTKLLRPVEELDKKFDVSTKLNWIQLQISKTEEEFKKKKKMFFNSADHSKLKNFEKNLKTADTSNDEVACEGLFDSSNSTFEVLDSGILFDKNWDGIVNNGGLKTNEKTYNDKSKVKKINKDCLVNSDELYLDFLADNIIESTAKQKRAKRAKANIDTPKTRSKTTKVVSKNTIDKEKSTPIKKPLHLHHHSHLSETELLEIQRGL